MDRRKWPDRPHYRYEVAPLGEDAWGGWFHQPAGTPVHRGKRELFTSRWGAVILISPAAWWSAYWHDEGAEIDVYVDVHTPPSRDGDTITMIDLDLDVVRFRDGGVLLADQDEFERHRAKYGYPPAIVAAAEQTAAWLLTAVRRAEQPFRDAEREWFERAREAPV